MITFFVIFNPETNMYIRAGRANAECASLNFAKHFCNRWGAENYIKRLPAQLFNLVIRPIVID